MQNGLEVVEDKKQASLTIFKTQKNGKYAFYLNHGKFAGKFYIVNAN